MGRILALDIGKKRVGVAVTDPLKIIANGLTTLNTHEALSYLENYIKTESVEIFVAGYARQVNGEDSEAMRYIKPFVQAIKKRFPQIPVEWVDERFTSKLAQQTILSSGIRKMARRDKELVDKVSATIILQSYLESIR